MGPKLQNGILLIILSMSLTPAGDTLAKGLGASMSPFTIVFLRYFVGGIFGIGLALARHKPVRLAPNDTVGTLFRTALVIGAMTLLVFALARVPLASAVAAFLISPIVAIVISTVAHGERLGTQRLIGAMLGLAGALLILRPTASFDVGMIYALSGGILMGGYLAATRATRQKTDPTATLVFQCLFGAAMLLPFVLLGDGQINWAELVFPSLGLGAVTAATHFLTVAAYQRAPSATLAPFFYFNLIAAILIGAVWFHEVPNIASIAGFVLIAGGGLVNIASHGVGRAHKLGALTHTPGRKPPISYLVNKN